MSKLDLSRPVQTLDGRKARIVCTDGNFPYSEKLVVLVDQGSEETVELYHEDGRYFSDKESAADLVNVPEETVEYWHHLEAPTGAIETFRSSQQRALIKVDRLLPVLFSQKVTYADGKVTKVELV